MKKLNNRKLGKSGFTLIEVVLVLAIGGLIFLLAFLAFQQSSINRRDTQRRSDAGRVVAELQNYLSDKSYLPDNSASTDSCTTTTAKSFGQFAASYLCKTDNSVTPAVSVFKGPQGNYALTGTGAVGSTLAKDTIRYRKNSDCSGGSTGVSVEIGLEKGTVCRDDQ